MAFEHPAFRPRHGIACKLEIVSSIFLLFKALKATLMHQEDEIISICYCSKHQKHFGLVVVRDQSKAWVVRHAFRLGEHYPESELSACITHGAISLAHDYNGCKFCGNKSFFQCGSCRSFSCSSTNRKAPVKCGKCGIRGYLHGSIQVFSTGVE
jgi:hypothetical protein